MNLRAIDFRTTVSATQIAQREYWIDNQVAARTTLGASPAVISLDGLSTGLHSLTVRVQDDTGLWSSPVTKYFVVPKVTVDEGGEVVETTIARYMYWIDDEEDAAVTGTLDGASGVLPIDIGELTEGEHTLSWRVADSKGAWSEPKTEAFTFTRTAIVAEMISLAQDSYEYAAEDFTPEVTVKDARPRSPRAPTTTLPTPTTAMRARPP